MSLNRPQSLGRQKPPRALTLPTTTHYTRSPMLESTTTSSSTTVDLSSYLPFMEESLQEWLSRNIPESNSPSPLYSMLHEACPCCGKHDCEHMETLYKTMRKLESDTRLAAEIGQGLLHKHEVLVAETNQTKDILEEQLNEFREKVSTLEMLLVDADNSKQELVEQKDHTVLKLKKSQKALQETSLDFEKANERCIEIGNELKNKTKEVEKLRIFKFMVRQADYREDMLRSQLEDTNQELAISRKNELMLESKYKKLKARYETVCTTYEKLKMDDQPPKKDTTNANTRQLDSLWKSNEQLRNDIIKLTSFISRPLDQQYQEKHQPDQNYFITLIKELALANAKLKMDLLSGNLLALERNLDDSTKMDQVESLDDHFMQKSFDDAPFDDSLLDDSTTTEPRERLSPLMDNDDLTLLGASASQNDRKDRGPLHDAAATYQQIRNTNAIPKFFGDTPDHLPTKVPSPTTSTSLPTSKPDVIHYHYHYHMQNKKRNLLATPGAPASTQKTKKNKQPSLDHQSTRSSTTPKITVSPTSPTQLPQPEPTTTPTTISSPPPQQHDSINSLSDDNTPYHQLQTRATYLLDRLKSTDIRSLNRQLQRAFDMMELSRMSNSIIDSILADILLLDEQFLPLKTMGGDQDSTSGSSDDDGSGGGNSGNGATGVSGLQQASSTTMLLLAFTPTLTLMQHMLKEIGELRMTMNDLQVEYVKKVEEIQHLVEQDILRKHHHSSCTNTDQQRRESSSSSSTALSKGRALAWLSNVFHIAPPPTPTPTPTCSKPETITAPAIKSETSQPQQPIRYQRSCDSLLSTTARNNNNSSSLDYHDSSNNNNGKLVMTTSSASVRIKQKKNDFDRFGPASSFPRSSPMNEQKRRRRSGSKQQQQQQQYGYPLRPSVSAGPGRKCTPSPGIWSTGTTTTTSGGGENTVQRKRSLLGLGGSVEPFEKIDSSSSSTDWKLGTSFGGSWLGT
ncbi:unnamed protein product [Absidia cylindrospora]